MGMLFVSPALREQLAVPRRGYPNLADPDAGLQARVHEDARRFDAASLSAEALSLALGAIELLQSVGWPAISRRATGLAASLAEQLARAGREPVRRDASTLVSFMSRDAAGERERLAAAGVAIRNLPEREWLRASVGAWNDERDLERLVQALA